MSSTNEPWQIQIDDQIYQADDELLKIWLIEGRIKPTDKIRKTNQEWLEIAQVLVIQPAKKASPMPSHPINPIASSTTNPIANPTASHTIAGNVSVANISSEPKQAEKMAPNPSVETEVSRKVAILEPIFYRPENWQKYSKIDCQNHQDVIPAYVCPECGASFCQGCAKDHLVGGGYNKACQCQFCGALCRAYPEVREKILLLLEQNSKSSLSDLKIAFLYPFGVGTAPIAAFVVALTIGGFAFPFFIGISILLRTITTITRDVASGNIKANPLGFDYSSFFTEVLSFGALGLGVILVSFSPMFALCFGELKIFSILMPLAMIWGFFYYPIALLVAGVTESFASVINPLLGLETVKRIGKGYYKHFLYLLALQLPTQVFAFLVASLLIEGSKNASRFLTVFIMLMFLGLIFAAPIFYTNSVMAALIGRAIFKSADRLGIRTNATTKL